MDCGGDETDDFCLDFSFSSRCCWLLVEVGAWWDIFWTPETPFSGSSIAIAFLLMCVGFERFLGKTLYCEKKRAWFSTCDHFCYLRDLPYLEDFWPRDKLLENEEWNVVDFFRREKSFTSCVSPVSLLDLSEKHEPENKIHIKQPHTSCTPNKCRLAHKFWAASKKKTQRKTNHPQ